MQLSKALSVTPETTHPRAPARNHYPSRAMAPPTRTLVIPCQPSRRRLRPPPPATRGTDLLGRPIEWSVRNVFLVLVMTLAIRSEERRVGKEIVSKFRSRCSQ